MRCPEQGEERNVWRIFGALKEDLGNKKIGLTSFIIVHRVCGYCCSNLMSTRLRRYANNNNLVEYGA